MEKKSDEMQFLPSRMQDLAAEAARIGFSVGKFLTPEARALLSGGAGGQAPEPSRAVPYPGGVRLVFLGGYDGAERTLPLFYDPSLGYDGETLTSLAGIVSMEIRTASGDPVSHRQILGSLMALGVKRETVGDILPFHEGRAVFFTLSSLAPFFRDQLCRVGRETVRCEEVILPRDYAPERKTTELHITVASLRTDCLAAALLQISREKAQALIRAGLLAKNHIPVSDPATPFREGDRITVRGEGRFDITHAEEENRTKRGRIRLTAIHYTD